MSTYIQLQYSYFVNYFKLSNNKLLHLYYTTLLISLSIKILNFELINIIYYRQLFSNCKYLLIIILSIKNNYLKLIILYYFQLISLYYQFKKLVYLTFIFYLPGGKKLDNLTFKLLLSLLSGK